MMIDWLVKAFRSGKLRKLVTLAVVALTKAYPSQLALEDRLFEAAVNAAARASGTKVNARELRLAVADARAAFYSAQLKSASEALLADIDRWQRNRDL
jgi:hypothetical protein